MDGLYTLVNNEEIALTKKDIECLEFAIKYSSKEGFHDGGYGIKASEFIDAGFHLEQLSKLVKVRYFDKLMIMPKTSTNACAFRTGAANDGAGIYVGVNETGIRFYESWTKPKLVLKE